MNKDEIISKLGDRWWRLNNLYYIKDKKGQKVLFQPNEIQKYIYDHLWFFTLIPKARQLGVTTFFCILYLDQVLFSNHKTAGIIAHRQEDMKRIFSNKIKFAYDNLPPAIKAYIGEPNTDNANELSFSNGSNIFVSMSTRSGTINFLHISEFAYVCQKFPEKAEEIVTGAINSVDAGQFVSIESTAAGREGFFFDFCKTAEENRKRAIDLTELDFKIFFFPWWQEPSYNLSGANFLITAESNTYFKLLKDKHGIELTDAQKRWYIKKKEVNGEKMMAEYPSTLDEAFSVSVDGSYYASQMNRVYLSKRIQTLPYDSTIPVDTYWDLGYNDENIILFVQSKGPQIRFIDVYTNRGEPLSHYAQILKEKGYRYGTHHFPWDIEVTDISVGITRKQVLYELGIRDVIVAPKIGIQDGIERVRSLFPRFYFDEVNCAELYDALGNYRKDFDTKLGVWKNSPRHDVNSHWADATRVLGVVWREKVEISEEEEKLAEQSFFG